MKSVLCQFYMIAYPGFYWLVTTYFVERGFPFSHIILVFLMLISAYTYILGFKLEFSAAKLVSSSKVFVNLGLSRDFPRIPKNSPFNKFK
eukprot:snap_masked-scaffold_18-processed-gene-6.28-mRNA-1 protein AED:1.00 eAED:1.00 QI:0/0/0/0/1/1/2/0/89